MPDWKDRKVLVLGLGDTGLSMARWLTRHGARVRAADSRALAPHAATLSAELPQVPISAGAFNAADFAEVDAIAISPGIDRRQPLVAGAVRGGLPVIGDVEIFAGALSDFARSRSLPRPKVLAVTGSNGKSTVVSMAGEAVRAAGRTAVVAGNIGLPVLDALTEIEAGAPMPDVFVLELSSFQLESTSNLDADAAAVLNVTEDHLDRYDSLADYAHAKARVYDGKGAQVLNRGDAWSSQMAREGRAIATFGADYPRGTRDWGMVRGDTLVHGGAELMSASELCVAGSHNALNALAALALGDAIGLPTEPMLEGLRRFGGLPHRMQRIAEVGGVTFFDDSKGTNVGATAAALAGLAQPVVLIAGGDGKGQDFSPLREPIEARARAVVLIGRDAPRLAAALAGSTVSVLEAASLEAAVEIAYRASHRGDAVLLSPACASYDMFRSYVHRGEVFVGAVRALAAREGAGS